MIIIYLLLIVYYYYYYINTMIIKTVTFYTVKWVYEATQILFVCQESESLSVTVAFPNHSKSIFINNNNWRKKKVNTSHSGASGGLKGRSHSFLLDHRSDPDQYKPRFPQKLEMWELLRLIMYIIIYIYSNFPISLVLCGGCQS